MSANTHEPVFHFFPQLPTELRLAIWRECFPIRVAELDYPWDKASYLCLSSRPCRLQKTTDVNRCPPVISRVCRESRYVASKTGHVRGLGSPPPGAQWTSSRLLEKLWIDPSRDSIHLNWTPVYKFEYSDDGSALDYLAWSAARARGSSFMLEYIDNAFHDEEEIDFGDRVGGLQKLQNAVVVMRVVVVHTSFEIAARTGLFGLLGDACVQIVDVSDEQRLDALFSFAEKCESKSKGFLARRQDFHRDSPEFFKTKLEETLIETFGAEVAEKLPRMCPAIMFRFCPNWCNHILL